MIENVEKYSAQYWINRSKLLAFMSKIGDYKKLSKKVSENPQDENLELSLFNLGKFITEKKPSFLNDKTFYQVV